ncbi:hypothetical protein DYB36_012196 [Aphanomyces astaci]|uniref:Uncharacterized protein n=1 Tax=Aphanomyces astaci TaxID=112090 RepID=A0A397A366_APHAT|nr:hypothetical protein DYB36_012196 [Aphanomyces astaci]
MSIVGKENKTMNQLLMEGEWNIYYVSALYKFQQDREALTTDAMDLVVFLRTADDRDLKPHQGVSVSVRSNDDMAVFSIQEQVAGTGGASGQSVRHSLMPFPVSDDLVDHMIRSLCLPYFSQLSEDLESYCLAAVSSDDCELDNRGIFRILRTDRVSELLSDLVDIFTAQDITIPETPETTL